jgi:iron complex outermembrane receptor protein
MMPTFLPQAQRRCLLAVVFILLSTFVFSQTITGLVTDDQGAAQGFASVALLRAADSVLIKTAVSTAEGRYEFDRVPAGRYFTRAQMVGSQKADSAPFDLAGADVAVPALALRPGTHELQEVAVVAQKPLIEVQADKLIFNVDASPGNTGLNALELLRKSPGVSLDQNENISLKGRQQVLVQINGKLTPMQGQDLAQYLKSINASDLEAIEIIATPGAKYDAEGRAGIINLRLKKDKRLGTNGSVSAGYYQGITAKGDAQFSINHRARKFNLFGAASMFRGRFDNTMRLDNRVNDRRFNQSSQMHWFARPNTARVGLDYLPNQRHTFGMLVTGGVFTPNNWSDARTEIGSVSENRIDSLLIAANEGRLHNWNSNLNLNYKYAGAEGAELNLDADYGVFRDRQTTLNRNFYRDAENLNTLTSTAFRMKMPRDIDIKSFKADYQRPVSLLGKPKDTQLGAGGKLSEVFTDNTFNLFNVTEAADELDPERSNTFRYRERIAAGYVNGNTKLGKWSLQAGLRMEYTSTRGELLAYKPVDNEVVDTAYASVFPSAALSYQLSEQHQFSLTYRRSIDRPRYQDLNPFEFRIDELSFRRGNPFIRPQFTNTVELGWTLFQRVNVSASYAHTVNAYANITDQEVDPVTGRQRFFIQVRNLATVDNYGLSLNTPIPIAKWWNGNLNAWYNYSVNEADYGEGRVVNLRVGGGGFWTQHTFTLTKTLNFEASGWFNVGGLWGAFVNRPQGVMDVGLTQKIWNGAGTVRVSFTDVFHTARWSSYTDLGDLYVDARGTWEGQQFKVNLAYRFGNNNVQGNRRRTTGAEEESRRAGDGGGGGGRN